MKKSMLYPQTTATRRVYDMCGMWKFRFDAKSEGEAKGWCNGLGKAELMVVPSSFNDYFTDKESREYTGDFWYETSVFIPGELKDKNVAIRFDGVTHRAVVFVNGTEVAQHEGGFVPFTAEINNAVKWDEENIIVVKGNNELSRNSLPAGETRILADGKKICKPYFDFFNYSGIIRPVRLVAVPKESIIDFSVVHELHGADSVTSYIADTSGEHDVEVTVYDEEGSKVASSCGKAGEIRIQNVKLWNVRNAYLYTFHIKIKNGDTVIDEYSEKIGIRTVKIDGTEILINNKPVYLKGFGKHEDSPLYGRGYNPAAIKRDFELMKWCGANSFRTAHYPYSEEIMQMADREGFLVIDEVAAVGFFESIMNFMEASSKASTGFFTYDDVHTKTKQVHKDAIKELIQRDKNRACVFAWSLMNEPETTNDAAVPYFREIFDYAAGLDPQERPKTFALIAMSLPDTCTCYSVADFLCLNRYYGWYMQGGYEIGDAKDAFISEMDKWKAKNLDKPFVFSEFGADTISGMHKLPSVMWSEEYQKEYLKMQFEVFDSYDFVKGEQIWNFADFQTTEGIMRADGNKKGIFTRDRQPKLSAYFIKERWEELPDNYKERG